MKQRFKLGKHFFVESLMAMFFIIFFGAAILVACGSSADVASSNVSKAADNFEVYRRIVFYNGITDSYVLELRGYCSLGNHDPNGELSVVCKTGEDENGNGKFVKHFLGLSDNVTYFAEQIESSEVDTYHYRVIFRPQTVIPDVEIDTK